MDQSELVDTLGWILKRYGIWIVAGLMGVELVLAWRRGQLS